ncbi:MAG: hypothetical protein Q8N98_04910 [bacterium]|nr:hypothetical protein [bacterium]
MKNEIIISSLAMDLKRAAIGLNRGSLKMAEKFCAEAAERRQELDVSNLKQYVKNVIFEVEKMFAQKDNDRKAEGFLMYSTILQNFVVSNGGTVGQSVAR